MKNVIFIAPPAAGKGTQSSILEEIGYEHISTGDMLREEIVKKTEIGMHIESIMNDGLLVEDEIVFKLIYNRLKNLNKPFIFDGFPRTLNQAISLDEMLNKLNKNNYEVIYLDIEMEEALKRALSRITCKCGASYNTQIEHLKPNKDNICDKCKQQLIVRNDDNEKAFKIRFETFMKNIQPIMDYYLKQDKLHIIDTKLNTLKITDMIKEILK